jgi:hypothetical protein
LGRLIGIICALYALHQWIITDNSPQRRYAILSFQGYLSVAFIIISLFLWTSQTLAPELARIRELQQNGVEISFDFSVLELRNWRPWVIRIMWRVFSFLPYLYYWD